MPDTARPVPIVTPLSEVRAVRPAEVCPDVLPAAAPLYPSVLPVVVARPDAPEVLPVRRGPGYFVVRLALGFFRACVAIFGAVVLTFGLAVLAAVPVVQFLSLGYLLESAGRIARTGRLRDGFIGLRRAAVVGLLVVGFVLVMLPSWFVAGAAESAELIDPGGPAARGWRVGHIILTLLTLLFVVAVLTGLLALHVYLRGGRRQCGGYYAAARDAVWDFVTGLRLPYYFWLGLRGFVGALVWIAPPVTLLAVGRQAPLLGWLGALLFGIVLMYLPFLQTRFAAEGRFRAFFQLRAVRAEFRRAPWLFALTLYTTLLFALPLYLLKIEVVPRDAAWMESLVFMVFIFPARLLTGWACGRARHRPRPRHWFFRWTGRLSMIPAAMFYVLIVYFTQFISWYGIWSLYEQHAFLLPVPFLAM